jgi:hypothetical protein
MAVNTEYKLYTKYKKKWDLCRDFMESEVEHRIPDIDPKDKKRSQQYREDAQLTNFTARTVNGFVGLIFSKDPSYELTPKTEHLLEDATGDSMHLFQLAKESCTETILTARYIILSDFPELETAVNRRDQQRLNLQSKLRVWKAESAINWGYEYRNNRKILNLLVLKDVIDYVDEDFIHHESNEYTVLRLDQDGYYKIEVYDHELTLIRENWPKKGNGELFEIIPVSIIGAQRVGADPHTPPIYDIAKINLGHYKNSASQEESIKICGQPSLFFTTDLSREQFKAANKNGIKIGARAGHNLGSSGSAQLLQASPNTLAGEGMEQKQRLAFMVGAMLLQPQASNETAAAAKIRNKSEISVLDSIATNNSVGIRQNLRWCAEFEGDNPDDIQFELNYEFFEAVADSQAILAAIQLYDRGAIALPDLRHNARKSGLLEHTRDDEDVDADISNGSPLV